MVRFTNSIKILFSLLFFNVALLSFAQNPGDLDESFLNVYAFDGTGGTIRCIAHQPDGKILIAGNITGLNNISNNGIARLNNDGSVDSNFTIGTGTHSGSVAALILQPDGKILIGGNFTLYNGVSRKGIARLNSDGTLDTSFNIGSGANYLIESILLQPDGKIVVAGNFTIFNGMQHIGIARLNPDGSLDTTFNAAGGPDNSIHCLALQPNGKILVGGLFTSFDNTDRKSIVRLNTDGSIDTSFNTGTAGSGILSLVLQPDNKILIGGFFSDWNGVVGRNRIARLNSNGSVDMSFNTGTGANMIVYKLALLNNGKVLMGGQSTVYNGVTQKFLTAINSDGSIDTSYNFGTGPSDWISSICQQPNGKILIGGRHSTYNGIYKPRITRLLGECNTLPPVGDLIQTINVNTISEATIEDLHVIGTNIKWYNSQGNILPPGTQLISGTSYFATQSTGVCESPYLAITAQLVLNVSSVDQVSFKVYPNPATNVLNISSEYIIDEIEIYSIYGQKIISRVINDKECSIDISQLSTSTYIINVSSDNKKERLVLSKVN